MGADVYDGSPAARAVFAEAERALGFELAQICFEGPEDALRETQVAQPALLVTCIALLAAVAEHHETLAGFVHRNARFVAGHSLGEYTAAVASGALELADAVRLVRRRGELMAASPPGAMFAVIGLAEDDLAGICEEFSTDMDPVVIANHNTPDMRVISGATQAVGRGAAEAGARGARAIPLNVSGAFHSPLMRPAAAELLSVLDGTRFHDASVAVVSNVAAEPIRTAAAIRAELAAQMTEPVQWIGMIRRMADEGVDTWIEIGPGQVLKGMIRRILPGAKVINVGDFASATALRDTMRSAAVDPSTDSPSK